MDNKHYAKLLAYHAYRLGRQSILMGSASDDGPLIKRCMSRLSGGTQTDESLRRRMFYALVLAELHRNTDPVACREVAMELGQRLASDGFPDPYPIYIRIVQATTRKLDTGDFGDVKNWRFGNLLGGDEGTRFDSMEKVLDVPYGALNEPYDGLEEDTLHEVARSHGLV